MDEQPTNEDEQEIGVLFPEDLELNEADPNSLTEEKVDRILRRLTHIQAEKAVLTAQYQRRTKALDSLVAGIMFVHGARIDEFYQNRMKTHKGKGKFIDLSYGRIKAALTGRGYQMDSEKALQFALANYPDYVETKQTLPVTAFKKFLGTITSLIGEDQIKKVVDSETGEEYDWVKYNEGKDKISLELPMPSEGGKTKTVSIALYSGVEGNDSE